jgi:hypothetical protein
MTFRRSSGVHVAVSASILKQAGMAVRNSLLHLRRQVHIEHIDDLPGLAIAKGERRHRSLHPIE